LVAAGSRRGLSGDGGCGREIVGGQGRADLVSDGHRHQEPIGWDLSSRSRRQQEVTEEPTAAPDREVDALGGEAE
jgi:hypothetical protein